MLVSLDDFKIKPQNFDLTKSANILRIICGAFMFPHIAGKFAAGALSAATVGFFAKAGFNPPETWVYIAAVAEALAGVTLILGICTRFAALGAAYAGRASMAAAISGSRIRMAGFLKLRRHQDASPPLTDC